MSAAETEYPSSPRRRRRSLRGGESNDQTYGQGDLRILDLGRRVLGRAQPDRGTPVRRRRRRRLGRQAARLEVRHSRREPGRGRPDDRRQSIHHGAQHVRPGARRVGSAVERLVGRRSAVPRPGLRAHPPRARAAADGRRHHVLLRHRRNRVGTGTGTRGGRRRRCLDPWRRDHHQPVPRRRPDRRAAAGHCAAHARRRHAAVRGRPAAETRAGEVAVSETGHARDLPRAVLSWRAGFSGWPGRAADYATPRRWLTPRLTTWTAARRSAAILDLPAAGHEGGPVVITEGNRASSAPEDLRARRPAAVEAARMNAATWREVLPRGQARTMVTAGASGTGRQTGPCGRRLRTDSGTAATRRRTVISCSKLWEWGSPPVPQHPALRTMAGSGSRGAALERR